MDEPESPPTPSPDPDPSPEPAPALPSSPPRRRRIAVLAGVALLVIGGAIFALTRGRHVAATAAGPRGDGGGAIHAPAGPQIPSDDATGVHLSGFVIDGAGLPVVGAEVTAEPEKGNVERALQTGSGSGSGSGSASDLTVAQPTGADGRFVLVHLAPGRYRLRVTGAGLLAAEVRYVPVPSDEARIVVARQVSIDGTVTDGGKPAGGATVGLRGDAIGGAIELRADAKGVFHVPNLPEGRYQIYAWQAATAARALRVNLIGAGPFAPIELRLEAAAIVVGRVIDREEGTGVVAAIELRPQGDDQAPRYARSGEDGVFRIEGVPNGRWIADAFAPGYLSPGGLELEAGRGVPELALARGAAVQGRVLDGDGHPIAGAAVRAVSTPHGSDSGIEISAQVDQDRLRRYSGRTQAPQEPDHPAADPQLIARGELGVMVGAIPPIPPPGAQVARPAAVVDPSSAGLAGEPAPLPIDPAHASTWVTGADGVYRITGLPRSKLTVVAQADGFAEARSRQVAVSGAEVVPGVDIVLTAGTFIAGRITDQHGAPVVGAELSAQPEVGSPAVAFSDADGAYRIGPVAGALELRATAYGHAGLRRQLELSPARGRTPAERHEDLVLAIADATLAGSVDDTTGAPVAGAHLEVSDGSTEGRRAMVAVDGTFSIDMLPPGHVRVRIEHPAYPVQELDAVASSSGERVRLVIALGGAIEGVLLDNSTGAPVASTPIAATGPGGVSAEATSDTQGRWKLGPLVLGTWRLEVKQAGYRSSAREVDVPAARTPGGTSVRDVRIDLARGAMIGGTIRDARGTRLGGAHVAVRAADGATLEGDADAQGEFRLRDCPTGDVVVTAAHGDQTGFVRTTVRPGGEVLGLAIELR